MAILAGLLGVWLSLGIWIVGVAPYASGTDESIKYVAFAAAKNRWATAEDYKAYGIDHYYYPPLYFLIFSPFFGNDPSFVGKYPSGPSADIHYLGNQGGLLLVSKEFLSRVPQPLWRLYRTAKGFSLVCGFLVLLAMAGTSAILARGKSRWWVVLGSTAPFVLLPQFLYYQTLVNNDALLNALAALSVLAFTAGVVSPTAGTLSGRLGRTALPILIGLALLTKQSALVLAPLSLVVILHPIFNQARTGRRRMLEIDRSLLVQLTLIIMAGGWWLLRGALSGDPFGFEAQRATHGWAQTQGGMPFAWSWLLLRIARSFIALFSGLLIGIPDRIFLLYLAVPVGILLLTVPMALLARKGREKTQGVCRTRCVFLLALGCVVALNVISMVAYHQRFFAPFGRLLFPSLGAFSAGIAVYWTWATERMPRYSRFAITGMVVSLGILFGWVFSNRMAAAVRQPDERLVPLVQPGDRADSYLPGTIWSHEHFQIINLAPGRLLELRVKISRPWPVPQFGSVITGRLEHALPNGSIHRIDLVPFALGDNDATDRWTELRPPTPLDIRVTTRALLTLSATPPHIFPKISRSFWGAWRRSTPVGDQLDLAVTAIYQ